MKKKLETHEDIRNFVLGCTFMGTGGGGDPEEGIKWLDDALSEGYELAWHSLADIKDEELCVCPFLMGSIAPEGDTIQEMRNRFGCTEAIIDNVQAKAVQLLEEYCGKKMDVIVPIELGGGNTAGALVASAILGIKTVDGDYCGRAIPEISQITPYLHDIPICPISSTDIYGNSAIIKECVSYELAERIGKYMASATLGLTAQATFVINGRIMKNILVPDTLSKCLKIGETINALRKNEKNPVQGIVDYLGAWVIFEGKIVKKVIEPREDYYCGTVTVSGFGTYAGSELEIWFENENHLTWLNGKRYVTSPDLIIVVDSETAEPITNTVLQEDMKISVIGMTAVDNFRTEKALKILGPGHFNSKEPYIPIKKIMEE